MAENHVLLGRQTLSQSAASVTFSNIPQSGYTDLKIVASMRTDRGAITDDIVYQYNGDTTSGRYSYKFLGGDGSAASSSGNASTTFNYLGVVNGASATSNTFSNSELYIPNYLGSNQKSSSADTVEENNATAAYQDLIANLYNQTTAISSIKIYSVNGTNFVANSTFSLYGIAAVGTTPVIAPKASGGNITTDGTYWYHTFLASGTFTPATNLTCDYLVAAGGGGGGGELGGGGGAGGLRSTVTATGGGGSLESALTLLLNTAYTVTVGAGGAGGIANTNNGLGGNGTNSVFSTITSTGGGSGARSTSSTSGGSGGGAGEAQSAGAGTTNQGYAGGLSAGSTSPGYGAGGGGGAGVVGTVGTSTTGGNGGNGVATVISGSSTYYAGGGGGGVYTDGGARTSGNGGLGGGGNAAAGTANTDGTGFPGTANTGGGGGGAVRGTNEAGNYKNGGAGGSGIVIIRYAMA